MTGIYTHRMKTEPQYLGPYKVVQKTWGGSYILKEMDGAEHEEHYATFRLIPYILRDDPILYELAEEEIVSPAESSGSESDHASEASDLDTDIKMDDP